MSSRLIAILVFLMSLTAATAVDAEDGYRLWLRYDALPAAQITAYRARIKSLVITGNSAAINAIRAELETGLNGLLAEKIPVSERLTKAR